MIRALTYAFQIALVSLMVFILLFSFRFVSEISANASPRVVVGGISVAVAATEIPTVPIAPPPAEVAQFRVKYTPLWANWWEFSLEGGPGFIDMHADTEDAFCHTIFNSQNESELLFEDEYDQKCQTGVNSGYLHNLYAKDFPQWSSPVGELFVDTTNWGNFASPESAGSLLISEVAWAGSYQSGISYTTDEWIELYNPTEEIWNLNGVILRSTVNPTYQQRIDRDRYIGPYSYFILARKLLNDTALSRLPQHVLTLSLSNSEAGWEIVSPNGEILDSIPTGNWRAGKNDTANFIRTTAQRDIFDPTLDWSSWYTCSELSLLCQNGIGYKSDIGNHNFGTPGEAPLF